MIIYKNTLGSFRQDVSLNRMPDILSAKLREKHLFGGSKSEENSWNNSLHFMKDALDTNEIPEDCDVAIEYNIPQTSKRVDFMIAGMDKEDKNHIVIVELKQWAHVEKVDDVFKHSVRADLRANQIVSHPSYQAYSYKTLLLNYSNSYGLSPNSLNPCAYLHNMSEAYRPIIEDETYSDWTKEAPAFLRNDVLKLRSFILRYITKRSADGDILYQIDTGKLKPTKALQDSLDSMLCGNEEFMMIDEQAVAFDYIMKAIDNAQKDDKKHVVIVTGGPGTGKSVLAFNVLVNCISKRGLNASYITKNGTPRACYKRLLAKGNARNMVNLELAIASPFILPKVPENGLDVGIFDEAHRLVKRQNMYKGKDTLEDAIKATKTCIFFFDEDQRITVNDCYSVDAIKEYAARLGAIVDTPEPFELQSQFRCDGSDGYISFLNHILYGRETANTTLEDTGFDFRVFDTPQEMKDALLAADNGRNKFRMCAGYCYDWNVANGRGEWDVVIGDFKAKWNLKNRSDWFAVDPNSFNEIGCIHTVQGMEFDYVGVIIGKDLIYKDGRIQTDKTAVSSDDNSSGIRKTKNLELADRLIRNTYKVLMTRGQKGCFVFAEDDELREYLKSFCLK